MQNLIQIHLDKREFEEKPKDRTIGAISKRITDSVSTVTVEELAEELSRGKTAVCGIMNGNRSVSSFESQTVVMLDFDNEKDKKRCTGSDYLTLAEVKSHPYIQENASFIYSTFSSTEAHEKYRVVFILDKTLTRVSHVYNVYHRLFELFPQADIACKDPSRIFFGGTDYQEINFDNTLEVLSSDLTDSKVTPAQTATKRVKTLSASENAVKNTTSSHNEVAEAIANTDLDEIERLIGNKYAKQVPTVDLAFDYIKRIDMRKLFNLPLEGTFHDLFHNENTPSSDIYYTETGYCKYKCFSSSADFNGDLLDVVVKLTGRTLMESYAYLVSILKINIRLSEKEQEIHNMMDLFIHILTDVDTLKKSYPHIYTTFNRERVNLITLMHLFKSHTFYDTERRENRVLLHMSAETISKNTGIRIATLKRLLVKMRATGIITTLEDTDIPNSFLEQLNATKTRNARQYRTNLYEITPSIALVDNIESVCSTLNGKGFTANSSSNKGLVATLGTGITKKVYVQDKVTTDLPLKTRNFLKRMNNNATALLNEHNYIKEADLIPTLSNNRIKKSYATMMVQKFRGHMIDTLQLVRVKVTKATKAQYPQLENVNYGSFVYVKEDK